MKLLLLISLLLISGCQDKKNLLNLLFPSTMVIDYQDNFYEVSLQVDNLNTLVKKEIETSEEQPRLLVATSKGKTIEDALSSIEENERSVINLSHVKSIILKQNALNQNVLKEICNYAIFNPEMRMDSEIYYTQNSNEELFSTSFQLNRSQLYILVNSKEFEQAALSLPTTNLIQLTKSLEEDFITIHIPVLNVIDSKDVYVKDNEVINQKVYEIKDVLFLNKSKQAIIPLYDLEGLEWIETNNNNIQLNIKDEKGEISSYSSKVTSLLYFSPIDLKYHLKGQVNMVISKDTAYRSLEELKPIIKNEIYHKIKHTYLTGLSHNLDIFNIYYKAYLINKNVYPSTDNFVNELDVKVHIKGSYVGSY